MSFSIAVAKLKKYYKYEALYYAIFIAIYFWLLSYGFGPYITDDHRFRQTQTAITARYLNSFQDIFSYQIPVLGQPWEMPFELPLYQAITKIINVTTGIDLEFCGRIVAIAFFLLCFWPISRIIDWLGIKNKPMAFSTILLTPLYVFWSRSFMIETTALFFSLLYSTELYRLTEKHNIRTQDLIILFIIGVTAGLTKVTTPIPLFIIACFFLAYLLYKNRSNRDETIRLGWLLITHALILLIIIVWVKHTDAVKLLNPLGSALTSESLRTWNFGTLAQRSDPTTWFIIGKRTSEIFFPMIAGSPRLTFVGSAFLIATSIFYFQSCNKTRRTQAISLLFIFALPFAIFTNLHLIHNYYQNANAIFLSLALVVIIDGAIDKSSGYRKVIYYGIYGTILSLFVINSFHTFHSKSSYFNKYSELTNYIQNKTDRDTLIVITGKDWSPELPYYAKRKALMLPESATFSTELIESALRKTINSREKIGAFIQCGAPDDNPDINQLATKYLNVTRAPDAEFVDCKIFLLPS